MILVSEMGHYLRPLIPVFPHTPVDYPPSGSSGSDLSDPGSDDDEGGEEIGGADLRSENPKDIVRPEGFTSTGDDQLRLVVSAIAAPWKIMSS